jgi:hypothetical protein
MVDEAFRMQRLPDIAGILLRAGWDAVDLRARSLRLRSGLALPLPEERLRQDDAAKETLRYIKSLLLNSNSLEVGFARCLYFVGG